MGSLADFTKKINNFKTEIRQIPHKLTEYIAYQTLETAKEYSPLPGFRPNKLGRIAPYALGSYVASHDMDKLSDIKYRISNSTYYADQVEYIGWEQSGPYYVYEFTKEEIRERFYGNVR